MANNDFDALLRLALRVARIGTWDRDLIEERVRWSPELEEVFGLPPGAFESTETAFLERVHPEDRDKIEVAVRDAIAQRSDYSVEFRFRHASGEWRWMEGRGRAAYDDAGKPVRLDGIGMDITDRKRDELSRASLAAIVQSSDDAIVGKTLEGIVTSWNAGAARLFGYSPDEIIGKSITILIPQDLQHEEAEILGKIRTGQRIEHYETTRVAKDGRPIPVSLTISPVRDAQGKVVGASKISRDISIRRRVETELRAAATEREHLLASERAARGEAERLSHVKDEFLATLSHELRTPLNAIQGWAALLRQPTIADADRARGIETIERNARAQAQIINDLLDMSRIVAGKIHLEVRPVNLQEIITAAVDAVRPSADGKRIRLRTLLDSSIGLTRGDPNRLQQVLWNLLTNAVKFTPADGRIQLILERVNSHVEIVIEDSGIGISAEFLPYVFDRFRQADPGTTRRYGGLGLGLSIVRSLVEMHGGSVRVKSPGENQGSTFVVALPIMHLQAEDAARHRAPPNTVVDLETIELPRIDGISVLIVDDEPDGRTLVSRILQERGARTINAGGARQALEVLKVEKIDLLLSDIGMPDMDGFDLIRAVRALDKDRPGALPAIAVTAYARPEDRQRSLLAGYQMHIAKPVEARELIAGIASLIKISR